jgi:hypothetical protein
MNFRTRLTSARNRSLMSSIAALSVGPAQKYRDQASLTRTADILSMFKPPLLKGQSTVRMSAYTGTVGQKQSIILFVDAKGIGSNGGASGTDHS